MAADGGRKNKGRRRRDTGHVEPSTLIQWSGRKGEARSNENEPETTAAANERKRTKQLFLCPGAAHTPWHQVEFFGEDFIPDSLLLMNASAYEHLTCPVLLVEHQPSEVQAISTACKCSRGHQICSLAERIVKWEKRKHRSVLSRGPRLKIHRASNPPLFMKAISEIALGDHFGLKAKQLLAVVQKSSGEGEREIFI